MRVLDHNPPKSDASLFRDGPIRTLVNDRRVRYLLAGGITACVGYAIFTLGWLLTSDWIPYLAMAVIANLLTAVVVYPIYRLAVFGYTGPWLAGFFRFYAVFLWGLVSALVGLPLLVEVVHLHVLVALAIIVALSPLISYQLHRFWVFRRRS